MPHQPNQIRYRRNFGIFALAILLLVVSASLVFGADTNKLEPLQLRSSILVEGEQITFGDLFTNAEDLASKFIAPAPLPGRRMSLNPAGISKIVEANGRNWRNLAGLQRILVKRSGRRLSQQELSHLVAEELAQNGMQQQYELQVNTGSAGIYVPDTGTSMPMISDINFDSKTGRFVASLIPYQGAEQVMLRGRAWPTKQIPVLKTSVQAGDLIRDEDVIWGQVRIDRLGMNPILQPENIIGKMAVRSLRPNRVLLKRDLQIPHAVIKGQMITISYELPGLRLTARGKVLANAGMGEIVRAVNLSSSRTIDVTITGPGQAVAIATNNLGG